MPAFGGFLRQERQQQHLTLRKFAELVGVAPSYISNIESSAITPPSEDVICRMAHVLGIREGTLLARAGKLKASTLAWFWSQPIAWETLACASGMTEADARMYVLMAFPELAGYQGEQTV
jgi:transcriptional regulator with XRE-family HTH domain